MAYAIICPMCTENEVTVYDKFVSQYEKFKGYPVKIAKNIEEAVENADFIVLSVKPQNFKEVLAEIKECGVRLDGKVFISIAAGVKTSSICKGLGKSLPVIRTMPNTPLLIGHGVTALSRNEYVSDTDFEEVKGIFSKLENTAFVLPESQMNAVIAATSSAPAYIYHFIDCMAEQAERDGLDKEVMLDAICEMVKGSAEMVLRSDKTPKELVKMVTSPNGTTERAMRVFAEKDLPSTVSMAMTACTKRAEELSLELDK